MRWWKRKTLEELRQRLAKYEELAQAHRRGAEIAQKAGFEAASIHQTASAEWYEREAEKLRRKLARRGED